MLINESQIKETIINTINSFLNEHNSVVNNIKSAEDIIRKQWSSPDDYWYIKIEQRKKDFRNYNKRNGGSGKWWVRTFGMDGTSRENHVGYAVVMGNTAEDAVNSLFNAKVHIHEWARQYFNGQSSIVSNGNCDAIIAVCDAMYARAYMTINKRSMSETKSVVKLDNQRGINGRRSFEERSMQAKFGKNSQNDWDAKRPWTLIDCDIDDPNEQAKLEKFMGDAGHKYAMKYSSHDGMHYLFDNPDISKTDFKPFLGAKTINRAGDPPVLAKRDANMLLYSSCG